MMYIFKSYLAAKKTQLQHTVCRSTFRKALATNESISMTKGIVNQYSVV